MTASYVTLIIDNNVKIRYYHQSTNRRLPYMKTVLAALFLVSIAASGCEVPYKNKGGTDAGSGVLTLSGIRIDFQFSVPYASHDTSTVCYSNFDGLNGWIRVTDVDRGTILLNEQLVSGNCYAEMFGEGDEIEADLWTTNPRSGSPNEVVFAHLALGDIRLD